MEIIDNINRLLGDDLKQTLKPGARLKVAASCFSMYAFEALKVELAKIEELNFIFTAPAFVAADVTDRPYSRYPVYGDGPDQVEGVLYAPRCSCASRR